MRLFAFAAAMVLCAALVPAGAEILGLHVAGAFWNATGLTAPWLSQAGDVLAGVIGGVVIGAVQWAFLRRQRVIVPALAAGAAVGVAIALYRPAALLVAPAAAGFAGAVQTRSREWVRAQAIAAAWTALALALPFPAAARAAFLVGAGVVSAWGYSRVPVQKA